MRWSWSYNHASPGAGWKHVPMNAIDQSERRPGRRAQSWRVRIGESLKSTRPFIAAELLLIFLPFALRALGLIRNPSLLLFLIGWLSLWLRKLGWTGVGLRRLANWWRTILLGIAIGLAYDAVDVLAILPMLHRLTGQPVQLEPYGQLRGNPGAVLLLLILAWVFGAFIEEMGYRGYALNRIADLCGGSRTAFVLSATVISVLFGFAHLSQGVAGVLDNVLAGAFFAVLYLAAGKNLWLPIIVHGVVDTTSVVLLYLGFAPK